MTAATRKKTIIRPPEKIDAGSMARGNPEALAHTLSRDDPLGTAPQMSLAEMQAAHEKEASRRRGNSKVAISLRVDPDVLSWFKAQGGGHLSKMQHVLRAFVEAQKNR